MLACGNPHLKLVGADHEALQQEHGGAVTNETVPFHFTESQASISRSALCGLPSQHYSGPRGAGVNFVHNHMLQLLVVDRTHENRGFKGLSCCAISQRILSAVAETMVNLQQKNLF